MSNIPIPTNPDAPTAIVLGVSFIGVIALAWHMVDKNYALKARNVELGPTELTH